MNIDHVVLWVDSPKRSLEFFSDVVGLRPVRAQEFEQGTAGFPSVRVNDTTLLDLMDTNSASAAREFTGGGSGAGQPINHICLCMDAAEFLALNARLVAQVTEASAIVPIHPATQIQQQILIRPRT